ncbi:hypothetical protein ACFZCF_08330 [Streptomyces sp. NPDC007945]|uniref:hypothetical protein n=1 Tax=Streptomyces sp. NPDC007945 TaxID=3364797 RepID=UPI0036E65C54
MISEPELEGGAPFETAEVLTEERAPRPPRPRRGRMPWLWALGGAAIASAVWGAGLYAFAGRQPEGVDLRGYTSVEDLCARAELKSLEAVLGDRSGSGAGPYLDEPTLSESSCSVNFGKGEREQDVQITYTLHKQIDPGPEFAARAKQVDLIEPVGGVGEQAFFSGSEDGGTLRVLDGQAVLEFSLYRTYIENEKGQTVERGAPDLSGLDVPLTQDALALLAALRK